MSRGKCAKGVTETFKQVLTRETVVEEPKQVHGDFLPLGVYVSQGWDPEVVKKMETLEHEELGTLYRVPIASRASCEVERTTHGTVCTAEGKPKAKSKAKAKAKTTYPKSLKIDDWHEDQHPIWKDGIEHYNNTETE